MSLRIFDLYLCRYYVHLIPSPLSLFVVTRYSTVFSCTSDHQNVGPTSWTKIENGPPMSPRRSRRQSRNTIPSSHHLSYSCFGQVVGWLPCSSSANTCWSQLPNSMAQIGVTQSQNSSKPGMGSFAAARDAYKLPNGPELSSKIMESVHGGVIPSVHNAGLTAFPVWASPKTSARTLTLWGFSLPAILNGAPYGL